MWVPSEEASKWMEHKEYYEEIYNKSTDTYEIKIKESASEEIKKSYELFEKEKKEIDDEIEEAEKNGKIIEM